MPTKVRRRREQIAAFAEFVRRSRAAKKGWRKRKRRLGRRRRQAKVRRALRKVQKQLPKRLRKEERAEWEITIRYEPKRRGQAIGVTLRVVGPAAMTREMAILVAKRAGMGHEEKGFTVHGINWQKPLGGTREKSYDYGDNLELGLQVPGFTGLFGAGTVRAEKVKGD